MPSPGAEDSPGLISFHQHTCFLHHEEVPDSHSADRETEAEKGSHPARDTQLGCGAEPSPMNDTFAPGGQNGKHCGVLVGCRDQRRWCLQDKEGFWVQRAWQGWCGGRGLTLGSAAPVPLEAEGTSGGPGRGQEGPPGLSACAPLPQLQSWSEC